MGGIRDLRFRTDLGEEYDGYAEPSHRMDDECFYHSCSPVIVRLAWSSANRLSVSRIAQLSPHGIWVSKITSILRGVRTFAYLSQSSFKEISSPFRLSPCEATWSVSIASGGATFLRSRYRLRTSPRITTSDIRICLDRILARGSRSRRRGILTNKL